MDVFIEPLDPSPRAATSSAPATSASTWPAWPHDVGFRVHVLDDREKFANRERFPAAADVVVDDIADVARRGRPAARRLRRRRDARTHARPRRRCARSPAGRSATSA